MFVQLGNITIIKLIKKKNTFIIKIDSIYMINFCGMDFTNLCSFNSQ